MNPYYPAVAERAGGRCEYCRAPEQVFNFAFEVDHIQPASRGGTDDPANLALACEACNLFKSDVTRGWDHDQGEAVSLFNPREQRWDDHFEFIAATGELRGKSAIGRATVTRLRMNSDFQVRARRHWAVLGLYP